HHRASCLTSEKPESRLRERPRLAAIVLISGEDVGQGIGDDQFRAVFFGSTEKLIEYRCMLWPAVERHQRIVIAQPRQPADRPQVRKGAAKVRVDVLLPAVHLIEIIFAEEP